MKKALVLIKDKYKKRHQRGKGIKLQGIKSLEYNYNAIDNTYNPSFHLILSSLEVGTILKKEWRLYWNDPKIVLGSVQRLRRVLDTERDLIETVKYGSNIFTEPDIKQKGKKDVSPNIYIEALYNIFCVLRGVRIFDRFGFDLPSKYKRNNRRVQELTQYQPWEFSMELCNWLNPLTEELLTGYQMSNELQWLLDNCLVTGSVRTSII